MDFDVKIEGGSVFDGSGAEGVAADVGLNGDVVAGIGDLSSATAGTTVDATGCLVCPGFVDAHTHSDAYLLIEPFADSKIFQGVTTEICGHCGASAAPLLGGYRMPADWENKTFPGSWSTVAEYRELFDEVRPAVNAALLVGHNTLHAGICGYEPRGATPEELRRMRGALERALDEGAIGLSAGLAYPPGSAVPAEEPVALCEVVARHGGVFSIHLRSESDGLIEAIDEAIGIARSAGVRLQISHLKASGKSNWDKLDAAIERIRGADASVGADRYPYLAGCTDLDVLLPRRVTYGGRDAILKRLRDPAERTRIRIELSTKPPDWWDNVMIGSTRRRDLRGRFLARAAKEEGETPIDFFLRLIEADELETGGIFFSMSPENLRRVLAQPFVSIGSDASLRAPSGPLSRDHPHPRAYGSHVRFLRMALDGETVPLPEAVRKMTSLPAEQYGLKRRGRLEKGFFADVAVIAPERLRENATYAEPHRIAEGIRHVFVNGVHTIREGRPSGSHSGRFLFYAP